MAHSGSNDETAAVPLHLIYFIRLIGFYLPVKSLLASVAAPDTALPVPATACPAPSPTASTLRPVAWKTEHPPMPLAHRPSKKITAKSPRPRFRCIIHLLRKYWTLISPLCG